MSETMIGHNSGVIDPYLLDSLRERADEFGAAAKSWGESGVASQDDSERITDFITGARGLWKEIDEARKEAKRPHDEAAKAVQSAFAPLLDAVKRAADLAKELQTGWLLQEKRRAEEARQREIAEARRAAEEAEARRKAAEEAGRAVAAAEAEREAEAARKAAQAAEKSEAHAVAKSASGGGRTVALRTYHVPKIVNRRRAFMALEDTHGAEIDEFLASLVRAEFRANGGPVEIPGVEVVAEERAA